MAKSSPSPRRRGRRAPKETPPQQGVATIVRRDVLSVLTSKSFRETIESVVIAFALAFLFRTFEAEAFVIPTGSMAPTLQGRHQTVDCPMCGFSYRISASSEIDQASEAHIADVAVGTCPNCHYSTCTNETLGKIKLRDAQLGYDVPFNANSLSEGDTSKSKNGDRILVSKCFYEFQEPSRWDVFVFRYPGQTARNYIKRLVGLPGETVRIERGDIFTAPYDAERPENRAQREFKIARKDPPKLRAIMQVVHDNQFLAEPLRKAGWPDRWTPWPRGANTRSGSWVAAADGRSFSTDGTAADDVWIRYQHFVPDWYQWEDILDPQNAPDGDPVASAKPQLITDAYAYNTSGAYGFGYDKSGRKRYFSGDPTFSDLTSLGLHWVGDLMVECDLEIASSSGTAIVELVEGGRRFACEIDVASGKAQLSIDGGSEDFGEEDDQQAKHPEGQTSISSTGTYRLAMANVDNQVLVWVDGRLVEFNSPTTYRPLNNVIPTADPEAGGDLAPAGIGSRAAALKVAGLRLLRDVYYIATRSPQQNLDYMDGPFGRMRSYRVRPADVRFEDTRLDFLSTPSQWPKAFRTMSWVEFDLARFPNNPRLDQFLAMGDNSPQSKDSRLWSTGPVKHYVERELLIGKALAIYWPPTHIRFVR